MVSVSENGKPVQKRRFINKEAPSGQQQFTDDQGPRSKRTKSPTTYRISDLPDGVLQDVLSRLPAEQAVRTSILSPRWRDLWTAAPRIQAEVEYVDDEEKFMDFVSRMLKGRSDKAPLKVLDIFTGHCEDVDYWISYAMTHSVEALQFYDDAVVDPFPLDRYISFSSSHLKILSLCNVSLAETHLSQLNHHCPNLHFLRVEGGHLETSEISSSSLKTLFLKECTCDGPLLISAPNLTLLRFINSGHRVVSLAKLPSLVKASVVVHFNVDTADDTNWISVEHFEYSMLRGLTRTKSLELNVPIREPLVSWKGLLGDHLFSNLTALALHEWCMADLYPVAWFLQQAPLLEYLHVRLRPVHPAVLEHEPRIYPKERQLRAACLNRATIICITTDPMVQELINLLRSAAKSSLAITINPEE